MMLLLLCIHSLDVVLILLHRISLSQICAPGVEILAAFTGVWGPSNHPEDHRFVKYNILSGTSIATAFGAGAAAYVRSFPSDWSPSLIKSAFMTTGNLLGFLQNLLIVSSSMPDSFFFL